AMHPPHPWVVVDETRNATIDYDLERARANIVRLLDPAEGSRVDIEYRYAEALRHACSAILGTYQGYLGNRDTSAVHLLKHWLTLGEHNSVLWQSCQLRMIDSDLQAIGVQKQELMTKLKRMEFTPRGTPEALAQRCEEFVDLAERLRAQRQDMEQAAQIVTTSVNPPLGTALSILKETIMSCFGCRKLKPLKDKSREFDLGYMGTIMTDDSVLARHPPSALFLYCADPQDDVTTDEIVEHAVDQLAAHQMSKTALIMCLEQPGALMERKLQAARAKLKGDEVISAASILTLRDQRSLNASIDDIIDSIFA
ncbi:MAG: hypothetical protein WA793_02160, partial [Sphingorhabdus sp.]|uniref:hypothetical protein n=1 Tax=Sphingorhabdus sp. TaxID=1902408 RepID=UPI003C85157E